MKLDSAQSAAMAQFDRQSDRYGRSHVLADVADLDLTVDGTDFPVSGPALDAGTGGGHAALWLARRGLDVTVSDISERMLANTRALLAAEGFAETVAKQHAAEDLPYGDGAFDVVLTRVAAHHFSDAAAFVREAARVMRPGGWLLVIDGTVPDGDAEAAGWANEVEKLRDPSHGRLMPPSEWRGFCDAAGLEVSRCVVTTFKQPDLEWYFDTAATSDENRRLVRELIAKAPTSAGQQFRLATEADGKITWFWHRLHLLGRKPGSLGPG